MSTLSRLLLLLLLWCHVSLCYSPPTPSLLDCHEKRCCGLAYGRKRCGRITWPSPPTSRTLASPREGTIRRCPLTPCGESGSSTGASSGVGSRRVGSDKRPYFCRSAQFASASDVCACVVDRHELYLSSSVCTTSRLEREGFKNRVS